MPAPDPADACAVWYETEYGRVEYEVFVSEQEAARHAVWFDGRGRTLGVQFPDGTAVKARDWVKYRQEVWAQEKTRKEAARNPAPPTPTRRAVDPFHGETCQIELTEPAWLGFQGGPRP